MENTKIQKFDADINQLMKLIIKNYIGSEVPADTINLDACSKVISR